MKQIKFSRNLLIFLLGFLSIGAFYGGICLIIKPDGSVYNIPVEILKNSPFSDFLFPGIILLLIFGIIPVYIIYALIKKPENRILQKLNLIYDYHFSWTFSVYIGIALIIWINLQTLFFNAVDVIHTIYSSLGIVIVCVALLPGTRKFYIK